MWIFVWMYSYRENRGSQDEEFVDPPKVSCFLWYHAEGCRPRWLIWMRRPTGDQEVAGSTPAEVGNIFSWRLIMKYFAGHFLPSADSRRAVVSFWRKNVHSTG